MGCISWGFALGSASQLLMTLRTSAHNRAVFLFLGVCLAPLYPVAAQVGSLEAVQAEVSRTDRQIHEIRVEIGNRYEKKLLELRAGFQKVADLENSLLIRAELQRLATDTDRPLDARNLVDEPRALREVQSELLSKQSEMITQAVQLTLPKLLEVKKSLTMAGKLDEAVEVRTALQHLQDESSPAQRLANNALVTAEEVFQAYQSSKERADTVYRGPKLLLRGKVAGVRPDPKEPGAFTLVLFGGVEGALVDCAFPSDAYRVREDRVGQNVVYVVARTNNDPNVLRVQRGTLVEIAGKCEGAEGSVRFGNCSLPKR